MSHDVSGIVPMSFMANLSLQISRIVIAEANVSKQLSLWKLRALRSSLLLS
jgi:hypothetical protein